MNRIWKSGAVVLLVAVAACDAGDEVAEDGAAVQDSAAGAAVPQALTTEWVSEELTYLADEHGRSLYARQGEPEGATTCYDECAAKWQPVLYRGGAVGAKGETRQALVSSFERADGSGEQLSYAGHALYHKPVNSSPAWEVEDEFGHWFLVRPNGELLTDFPTQ